MSAAKHTPGPWFVRSGDLLSTVEIVNARRLVIAEVGDVSTEDAANARLIAAAPELLEALRAVCDQADARKAKAESEGSTVHRAPEAQRAYEQARAAITKATGSAS